MSTEIPQEPVVIFDIGGVLVDWDPRHLYRKMFESGDEMEYFLSKVCDPEWNKKQDAGRLFKEAIKEKITQYPKYEDQIKAYYDRWPEMMKGPIESSVKVLDELRNAGAVMFALSNWSSETFPHALREFSFLQWFKDMVVSADVGHVKPEPEIYKYAAQRFGVRPQQCLFIDDVEANVEAARNQGFFGHHYTDEKALRGVLKEAGWLS